MIRLAPSILAADFSRLAEEVATVEEHVDLLHIDIMDGHFVPNITMGPNVVEALRPRTDAELDVHLMVENSDDYIKAFAEAGADMISVHAESSPHLHRTVQEIRNLGKKTGVALNPATPVSVLEHVLPDIDYVLIMTVNPGFGGQSFISQMVGKIAETKRLIEKVNPSVKIEVDGGINKETLPQCREAGADWFVAGSAVFSQNDRGVAIRELIDL